MIAEQSSSQRRPAVSSNASVSRQVTYLLAAVQFLTRVPTPALAWQEDTLARAALYFPLIGLAIGGATGCVMLFLAGHLSRPVAALLSVVFMVVLTGALHEDGLADCADAFGCMHSLERTLAILRDSRIGTFGALALLFSVGLRTLLLASLPLAHVLPVLAAAGSLSRWSILPLTRLPSARLGNGQGAHLAERTPGYVLVLGTTIAFVPAVFLLHTQAVPLLVISMAVTAMCAWYFQHRLRGATGDCYGATVQLVELALLLTGAWTQ